MDIAIAIISLAVIVMLWAIKVHNTLSRYRGACADAWSSLCAELDRRADAVALIADALSHSRLAGRAEEALRSRRDGVTEAETRAERAEAESKFDAEIASLLADAKSEGALPSTLLEDYEDALSAVKGEIDLAQLYYVNSAIRFNEEAASFPSSLVAWVLDLKEEFQFDA